MLVRSGQLCCKSSDVDIAAFSVQVRSRGNIVDYLEHLANKRLAGNCIREQLSKNKSKQYKALTICIPKQYQRYSSHVQIPENISTKCVEYKLKGKHHTTTRKTNKKKTIHMYIPRFIQDISKRYRIYYMSTTYQKTAGPAQSQGHISCIYLDTCGYIFLVAVLGMHVQMMFFLSLKSNQ